MTEAEWGACDDPTLMLEALIGSAGNRKGRLFVCACCRQRWSFLTHITSREAVEIAERFADGAVAKREMERAAARAGGVGDTPSTNLAAKAARGRVCVATAASRVSRATAVNLLRDVFANPFQPVHFALAWRTPDVTALATAAYDERILPSGEFDPHRLAVLADALEEAGASEDIVGHLREPGPHVRGCWVVDLCLGKQ